jgi:hypothetical protein
MLDCLRQMAQKPRRKSYGFDPGVDPRRPFGYKSSPSLSFSPSLIALVRVDDSSACALADPEGSAAENVRGFVPPVQSAFPNGSISERRARLQPCHRYCPAEVLVLRCAFPYGVAHFEGRSGLLEVEKGWSFL